MLSFAVLSHCNNKPSRTVQAGIMPIHFAAEVIVKGIPWLPSFWNIGKAVLAITIVGLLKWYSMGASNTAERQMHGKIVMITGV